jgi:hypothetical protein
MKKKYTDRHLAFLRRAYKKMKVEDVTAGFNKKFGMNTTVNAIRTVLSKNQIKCGRPHSERMINRQRLFTPDQIAYVRKIAPGKWKPEITRLINERFGTSYTLKQIRALMSNRRITTGLKGQFQKGGRPWNAGTRGQGLTGRNRGSFKPGNVPANRNPLWHERMGKDGFIEMKVPERNPYTGFPTRYKAKHVWMWEQKNGPVPADHVVAFKDSDRTNICPENLMLVPRAELLEMNRMRYREAHPEVKPSIRALVKLKRKMREVADGR